MFHDALYIACNFRFVQMNAFGLYLLQFESTCFVSQGEKAFPQIYTTTFWILTLNL
jgi:hypothetical protein